VTNDTLSDADELRELYRLASKFAESGVRAFAGPEGMDAIASDPDAEVTVHIAMKDRGVRVSLRWPKVSDRPQVVRAQHVADDNFPKGKR
jgi:hypothetical protein